MALFKYCQRWIFALMLLPLVCGLQMVSAEEDAPDAMVKKLTNDVLQIVKQDKDIKSGNTQKAIDLVEHRVLPIFNFPHMTALAVGKSWRRATPEQKTQLTEQFKTLLVRTYSGALTKFGNKTLNYRPYKMPADAKDIKLSVDIREPGKQDINLEYSMEKIGNQWKVYDVVAENVSMIVSYRDGFNTTVDNSGIDGLIAELKEKNASLIKAGKTSK